MLLLQMFNCYEVFKLSFWFMAIQSLIESGNSKMIESLFKKLNSFLTIVIQHKSNSFHLLWQTAFVELFVVVFL